VNSGLGTIAYPSPSTPNPERGFPPSVPTKSWAHFSAVEGTSWAPEPPRKAAPATLHSLTPFFHQRDLAHTREKKKKKKKLVQAKGRQLPCSWPRAYVFCLDFFLKKP